MNTVNVVDEHSASLTQPGSFLASLRVQKGMSVDYVAGKLHLRSQMITLLESDDYSKMPEHVFIQGYLRSYAKLLEVDPKPLLEQFNLLYPVEPKPERMLWQSRRSSPYRAESIIRWFTGIFAGIVLIAVFFWWQTSKENESLFPPNVGRVHAKNTPMDSDIRLTDLSKMRSILTPSLHHIEDHDGV